MDQLTSPCRPPHFLDGKTILVWDAGIAGLAFAVALAYQFSDESSSTSKPKVIIFERDSYEKRIGREGYTLSLKTDIGGAQILDRLGLYEQVKGVSVNADSSAHEGGGFNVLNPAFRPYVHLATAPVGSKRLVGMRIRRNALQKVLAQAAVDSGADMHWETAVTGCKVQQRRPHGSSPQ